MVVIHVLAWMLAPVRTSSHGREAVTTNPNCTGWIGQLKGLAAGPGPAARPGFSSQ